MVIHDVMDVTDLLNHLTFNTFPQAMAMTMGLSVPVEKRLLAVGKGGVGPW